MTDMQEPPELFDRDGNKIVVMRNSDGTHFSNHPDYPMALALHQQAEAQRAAEAEKAFAEAAAAAEPEVEEDEAVADDNNDGVVQYEEMTSKDLVTEAKRRDLKVPSGTKRSEVIELLQQDDTEKAGQ
jgi:hypothetical protein